jgi:hypothetical protein
VATRGLCLEKETYITTKTGVDIYPRPGMRVNYIELVASSGYDYFDDPYTDDDNTWYRTTTAAITYKGMYCIMPTNNGYIPVTGTTPQHWFNWGKYIILHPIPIAGYVLKAFYSDYITELINDQDILLIPKEFHRSVIDYAEAVLSIKLRRWFEVASLYNKCISGVQRAREEYIKRNPDYRALREVPKEVKEANG